MNDRMYQELVSGILSVFKDDITQIILYGSAARGTISSESDIDIAVFITKKMDGETEDKLSDIVVDMNLKYNKLFSVIDIDDAFYKKWRKVTPFYQNVEKEGIVLWKAA